MVNYSKLSLFFAAFMLINLGNAQTRIQRLLLSENYDKALVVSQKKLEKAKKYKDNPVKLVKKALPPLVGLSELYAFKGEFVNSEKYLVEALKLVRLREKQGRVLQYEHYRIFDELAILKINQGNNKEALEYIKQTVELKRGKTINKRTLYSHYYPLGLLHYRVGNVAKAKKYMQDYALSGINASFISKKQTGKLVDSYQKLTEIAVDELKWDEALALAKINKTLNFHSWTRDERGKNSVGKAKSIALLSNIYFHIGNLDKATKLSIKSLDYYNKSFDEATVHKVPLLMNRALCAWEEKKQEETFKLFQEVDEIQRNYIDRNFIYLTEYERENSAAQIRENITQMNAMVLDGSVDLDPTHLKALYEININSKAILLSQSNKALSYFESTTDSTIKSNYVQLKQLKNQLANLYNIASSKENNDQFKAVSDQIYELEKKLYRSIKVDDNSQFVSYEMVKEKLKSTEAAVELVRVPNLVVQSYYMPNKKTKIPVKSLSDTVVTYMAFIIDPTKEAIQYEYVTLKGNEEGKLLKRYQNTMKLQIEDKFVYKKFWKPIDEKVNESKKVFVSSDGIFHLMNVNTFLSSDKYMLKKYDVSNISNTKNIVNKEFKPILKPQHITLFGNPTYDLGTATALVEEEELFANPLVEIQRNGVNPLPGTQKEVENIQRISQNVAHIKTDVFTRKLASEEVIKDQKFSGIIHVATHGFFDTKSKGKNPLLSSGLLFAGVVNHDPKKKEDGILTAFEVSTLSLNKTDLVILSACETGLGDVKDGEGVFGLQRALEVAGVDYIITSLWKVDDKATQEFMTKFYEEFMSTNDIRKAFSSAQLAIKNTYEEPYYWGAFKITGL